MASENDTRLPVILLTGFLGAGKTTLLLRWLSESPATGLRMGVVMNEFGAESVDSQILDRPGLPVKQVSGGCICCASDNELDQAVARLVTSGDCDYVVVETSGLADPDNVIDVLTDTDLLKHSRLHAVITVVDGPWFVRPEGGIEERVLARRQIEFAHIVCLSKCDRLSAEDIEAAGKGIAGINPRAQMVKLPFGLPEIGEVLRRTPSENRLDLSTDEPVGEPAAPHLHTSYQSVTWRFPTPVDRSAFEKFLAQLNPKEVVRAKGFVRFNRQPEKLYLFQSVWGHHLIEEFLPTPAPDSVAVLIGPNLNPEKHRQALRTLVFGGSASAGKLVAS